MQLVCTISVSLDIVLIIALKHVCESVNVNGSSLSPPVPC